MTTASERRWRRTRRRRSGWRGERGAALMVTAWLFIVLFVVVLDFAASMRDDGLATANFADETQSYYVALAGLNRGIYDALGQLEEDPDLFDPDDEPEEDPARRPANEEGGQDPDGVAASGPMAPDGKWHEGTFAGGSYSVRLLDEAARISLNRASETLLMRIVRRLMVGGNATEGVSVADERAVSTVVHSILDWRDVDDLEHLNGAEAGYYNSLPRPYPIKNAPFDSVDELLLVRGVTPDLYYGMGDEVGLRELFSVFNRTSGINVLQAPAPVLRVLLDLDREQAEELVAEREEEPFGFVERIQEMMVAVDPELAELLRGGMSPVVSVEAIGRIGDRNAAHVAAVVDLSDAFEGPRIFRWLDRVPAGWKPGGAEAEAEDEA